MSVALAYLLKKPTRITKIRANRAKGGGLGNQHLTGVIPIYFYLKALLNHQTQALKHLTGSKMYGDKIASKQLLIEPSLDPISIQKMTADCKTVGSVHLILQILLPCLITAPTSVKLTIKGGTHTLKAPVSASFQHVLLPLLKRMGVQAEYKLNFFGFFPDLLGNIGFISNPVKSLNSVNLTDKGVCTNLIYYITYTQQDEKYAETKQLNIQNKGMSREVANLPGKKKAQGFSICAVVETSNKCYFSVERLLMKKERQDANQESQEFMDEVQERVLDKNFCIDEYHCDQLLVYMACAQGVSRMKVKNPMTLHFQTMITLLRIMIPDIKIKITIDDAVQAGVEQKKEGGQKKEGEQNKEGEQQKQCNSNDEQSKVKEDNQKSEKEIFKMKDGYSIVQIKGISHFSQEKIEFKEN